MRAGVLVTEGNQRAALALVRSLGRAGYRVHVASSRVPSLAGASRHAARELQTPDPLHDPEGHRARVRERLEQENISVLLPTTEASLISLLPLQEELTRVAIPFPPLDRFLAICDKPRVLAAAREVGIAVPPQTVLTSPEELSDPGLGLAFPLVVKPARSVVPGRSGLISTKVRPAADLGELRQIVSALPPTAFPLLLQRRIEGPGVGVFLLIWNGDVLAAFAHRRIRERPPSGGVSVFRESIPLDPDLLRRSRRLLERFGWQGVAMVEFKVDEESGIPHLMEVNGRFWGSLQLAVDAGVDFPALLVAAARGEPITPEIGYRTGVKCRWWWGEVDHVVGLLRNGTGTPNGRSTEGGAPESRWPAVRSSLRGWLTPGRSEIFRWSDPRPFLRETVDWVGQVVRR